jgi:hypothetical protein
VASLCGADVQPLELRAPFGLDLPRGTQLGTPRLVEARALRRQHHVGQPALALQAVHQPRGHVHQRGGVRQSLQAIDLAALGGQQKVQARFHSSSTPCLITPSREQQACRA